MKKLLLSFFVACLSPLIYGQVANYTFSSSTGAYTEITGTTTGISGDSDYGTVSLPFNFYYNGLFYNQVQPSTNGWLGLGSSFTSSQTSNNMASTSANPLLAPLWDDLNVVAANNSTITYTTTGVAPSSVFIVQWKDVNWNWSTSSGTPQNFQVHLHEQNGQIDFRYGPMNVPNSPSASI